MRVLFFIALALLGVSGVFASLRQFQMLQQNGYYPSRYIRRLKKRISVRILLPAAAVTVAFAAVSARRYGAVSLLIVAALSLFRVPKALKTQKTSTVRLVFTARVKRMLGAQILLFAACTALSAVQIRFAFAVALFSFAPPVPVLLAWAADFPLEKCLAARYTRDAKRRLSALPALSVIGVTGSYGKTGTKSVLGRMLGERYNTLVTPESYNTPMGVVRTVRERLRPETEVFVCEMGAKQKGDIAALCRIAEPSVGIITSVGPQHLETFGSVESVKAGKWELADYVLAKGGRVYLNADNAYLRGEAGKPGVVSYGTGADCDCRLTACEHDRAGLRLTVQKGGVTLRLSTRLLGAHNALNITGAAAVALDMGVAPEDIAYAVATLAPVPHRLEPKNLPNGALLIDDAYNANPHGARAALEVLKELPGAEKILVTPGLVELGEREYAYNRELGEAAAGVCDRLVFVGEQRSVPLKEGALHAGFPPERVHTVPDFPAAMRLIGTLCPPDGVVLLENDLPDNELR